MELDCVNSDKPYSHIRASMYVLSMPCGHGTCSSLFPRVVVVSETSAFAFLPSSPGSLAYISFLSKHGSASLAVKPSLSMKYFCLISLHHTYPAYDSEVLQVNFGCMVSPVCHRIGSSRPSSIASGYTRPRVGHTLEVAIDIRPLPFVLPYW